MANVPDVSNESVNLVKTTIEQIARENNMLDDDVEEDLREIAEFIDKTLR